MYISLVSERELWFVDKRMTQARAQVLRDYLTNFFEPVLRDFPELIGAVHLSLSSEGFYFRNTPYFQIVVNSKLLLCRGAEQLRFMTAYMLSHFSLHLLGYEWNAPHHSEAYYDKRAVLFAFSRGYAHDYLSANVTHCKKEYCDFNAKLTGFRCRELLPMPCRACEAPSIFQMSHALQCAASRVNYGAELDFAAVIQSAWASIV